MAQDFCRIVLSRIRSEILAQALKFVVEKLLGPLWTQITINEVVKLMGVLNFGLDREMDFFSIFLSLYE